MATEQIDMALDSAVGLAGIAVLAIQMIFVAIGLASMGDDCDGEAGAIVHRIPSRIGDRWLANTGPARIVDDRPPAGGNLFALITVLMNCPLVMKH
jgi:hypothetical protein